MHYPSISIAAEHDISAPSVDVKVEGEINEIFTVIRATQTYTNKETVNIESVYTFPLPSTATLLEMTAVVGSRTYTGVVAKKSDAEQAYEKAIESGDSAVMLENPSPGVYTANFGNLMPGESATIHFTYVHMNEWTHDGLRFFLPTTIAPRYGSPAQAGLQDHQIPGFSMTQENRMRISISVLGRLSGSDIISPSHSFDITREPERTVITALYHSSGRILMDRDFVLSIRPAEPIRSSAFIEYDGDSYTALASIKPEIAPDAAPRIKCVSIVIDCSGSMSGDSISQAKAALDEILRTIRSTDYFNIILFGSSCIKLFNSPALADAGNITIARKMTANMDADLGGTEIGAALRAALESSVPEGMPHDLLLITDGQVWDADDLIRETAAHGCRAFTVGVGSAVSEVFVRDLALSTGGACELAAPGEDIAGKIVAQFRRIFASMAEKVSITWPFETIATYPQKFSTVFDGDRLLAFATGKNAPRGGVRFETVAGGAAAVTDIACEEFKHDASLPRPGSGSAILSRLMASAIINDRNTPRERIEHLAMSHNLMSPVTNYILTVERKDGEKAVDLPELRKVRQTLAAGWHGLGTVQQEMCCCDEAPPSPPSSRRSRSATSSGPSGVMFSRKSPSSSRDRYRTMTRPNGFIFDEDEFEVPAYIRAGSDITPFRSMSAFIINFNGRHTSLARGLECLSFADLDELGLPLEILNMLTAMSNGNNEEELVLALLIVLSEDIHRGKFSRQSNRLIQKRYRELPQIYAYRTTICDSMNSMATD
ncbi:VIT domain-containing protein [Fundidesulfovibrio soli]|uniref:VIT domain-containing protein n=1 Tax=Fundidesulfovibrio soli TaxID=2922716 RepID=UPI001FB02743|nr:VIT domain-containing protein [Fundidesulfovibrio soli]